MPRVVSKKQPWSLAFQASSMEGNVIPEPKHRIGPEGVSSGISLRDFPKSCIEQVKQICLHYVDKCSGMYTDNKAAARYVHQMADEVIKQLASVSAQIQFHEQEPKIYETLLKEWKEYFPASLGTIGGPKAVANRLNALTTELEQLKTQIDYLKASKKQDVDNIMKSADVQIHAARVAGVNERKVFLQSQQRLLKECDETMARKTASYDQEILHIVTEKQKEMDTLKRRQEKEIMALTAQIKDLKTSMDNHRNQSDKTLENTKNEYETLVQSLQKENKRLRESMARKDKEIQDILAFDDLNASPSSIQHDNPRKKEPIVSLAREAAPNPMQISNMFSNIASSSRNSSNNSAATLSTDLQQDFNDFKIHNENQSKSQHLSKYQQKMRELKDHIAKLETESVTANQAISDLQEQNNFQRREINSLKTLIEHLRLSISSRLSVRDPSERVVVSEPFVLTHTPHFLGPPDREGLNHSLSKLSSYNNAGIF